jgi:hypothetical protein
MEEIQGFHEKLCTRITSIGDNVYLKYKEQSDRVKKHVESEIRRVLEIKIKQVLRRARKISRESIVDPQMFSCIKETIDDLFDDMWPEIENELMYALRLNFDRMEPFHAPIQPKRGCLCNCLHKIKASYLYAQYPCKTCSF